MTTAETPDQSGPCPGRGSRTSAAIVVLGVFVLALLSHRLVGAIPGYDETVDAWPGWIRGLVQPIRWMVLVLAGLALIGVRPRRAAAALGLAVPPTRPWLALGFALACSAPMLVLGLMAGVQEQVRPVALLYTAGIWPAAEEILFRGFAFGQLVRRAAWNIWAAAVVTGVLFGAVHLYNAEVQVHEIPGQLLSIGIIAAGGVVFAWLFHRWRYNLWIAIGLHGFMNLWFALFALADTPIGSTGLIAVRVIVPAIAIALTELHLRRRARYRRLGSNVDD